MRIELATTYRRALWCAPPAGIGAEAADAVAGAAVQVAATGGRTAHDGRRARTRSGDAVKLIKQPPGKRPDARSDVPEVHRTILGDYDGAYALGVAASDDYPDGHALLLRVEDEDPHGFPHSIQVDGRTVIVLVEGGFRAPSLLPKYEETDTPF